MSNISCVNQFFILFDINNKVGIHRDTYKLEAMRVTSNREVASWQTDRQTPYGIQGCRPAAFWRPRGPLKGPGCYVNHRMATVWGPSDV